jgi:hypothetical protein
MIATYNDVFHISKAIMLTEIGGPNEHMYVCIPVYKETFLFEVHPTTTIVAIQANHLQKWTYAKPFIRG